MNLEKKNKVLVISLAGLTVVALTLFLSGRSVSVVVDPNMFRLPDSKAINKVVFQTDTTTVELKYSGSRWRVNDQYEADAGLVDVLFATMAQATPKRTVASKIRDSVMRQARNKGVRVQFFQDDKIDKDMHVWGNEQLGVTYFIDQGSDTPFVMMIPGYRVFVGGIFVQNTNTWRDKRIFNFSWRNFSELRASFPLDASQNFRASFNNRFFSIDGLSNVDTTALNNYLDAVSLLRGNAFYIPGTSPRYDSLIQTKPVMALVVKEAGGREHKLDLFAVAKGEPNALARWQDDFIWFDRRAILTIYKKRIEFVKKAKQ